MGLANPKPSKPGFETPSPKLAPTAKGAATIAAKKESVSKLKSENAKSVNQILMLVHYLPNQNLRQDLLKKLAFLVAKQTEKFKFQKKQELAINLVALLVLSLRQRKPNLL